jgi:hypothetical protein
MAKWTQLKATANEQVYLEMSILFKLTTLMIFEIVSELISVPLLVTNGISKTTGFG